MARHSELELVNPRVVFQVYGVGMAAFGLVLYSWGPVWFHDVVILQPLALSALVRVAGACALLLAATALCLARFGDPTQERRTLWWFTGGRWIVAGTILIQGRLIWARELPEWYALGLWVVMFIATALPAGLAVVEDRGRRTSPAARWLLRVSDRSATNGRSTRRRFERRRPSRSARDSRAIFMTR